MAAATGGHNIAKVTQVGSDNGAGRAPHRPFYIGNVGRLA